MRVFLLLMLFMISISYLAQNNNLTLDFTPLKSYGNVPDEINLKSSKKYNRRKQRLKAKKRKDLKAKEKFILESTFTIDYMISNGGVLFNDELTNYVTGIADEILKDNSKLRKELSFYTLKSPYANAYTTDQGIIFVTTGLLARMENEAQLAFVIAHEISHYVKKHTMNGYLESIKIEAGKGEYKKIDWEKKLLAKSNYSKEKESEADSIAINFLKNTTYDLSEVDGSFTVLEKIDLPVEDVGFDLAQFESTYYKFPNTYKKIVIEEVDNGNDDELSTHPSVDKRKKLTAGQISRSNHLGKDKFVTKIDGIERIKDLARFELSYLYTKKKQYADALYNSLVLQKKYPFNKFLKLNIGYCIYALAKYKNNDKLNEVIMESEKVEGDKQKLNYFLEKVTGEDLNIWAVKYLWDMKKTMNNDYLDKISNDALKELVYSQKSKKKDFKTTYPINDTIQTDSVAYDAKLYAFVDHLSDSKFVKEFKKHERESKANDRKTTISNTKQAKIDFREDMLKIKKGRALGIEKIALVTPTVRSFDTRKEGGERYFHGEDRKDIFIDINKYCAKKRNLDLTILSNVTYENSDKYSNVSLLNDWVEERFSHGGVNIYPFLSLYSDNLKGDYGTNYFMWSGIYTLRAKKPFGNYFLFLLGSVYVFVPASIYYTLSDSQHTYYYSFLFDVENGDALMLKNEYFKSKDRQDYMKGYVYDTFNQIKQKK